MSGARRSGDPQRTRVTPRVGEAQRARAELRARSARRPLALLAVAVALPAAGCRRGERFPQAPVVLISIDTLRSDRVGVYGAKTGATPCSSSAPTRTTR